MKVICRDTADGKVRLIDIQGLMTPVEIKKTYGDEVNRIWRKSSGTCYKKGSGDWCIVGIKFEKDEIFTEKTLENLVDDLKKAKEALWSTVEAVTRLSVAPDKIIEI